MSQADIDQLARWRTLGARNSEQVVALAQRVLKASLGDQGYCVCTPLRKVTLTAEWAVREQLAIAALDLGQVQLANAQISALERKFPKSPRVELLNGLKLEAAGEAERARLVYEGLLKKDETNVSAHQRLIALALPMPAEAIARLLTYLDTFYIDSQGWSLLADLYAELGAYEQSLTALGHVLVLETWNSAAVVRSGETAYTMGDYQLALKHFLRAVEMETPPTSAPEGHRTRAWWGVKMSTKRLLDGETQTAVPQSEATPHDKLAKLDALATERILAVGGADMDVRRQVLGEEKTTR